MSSGLGVKIRNLRKKQKMTQAGLAEKLGISASYLNLMEHERRPVSAEVLIKVAEIFGVELREFQQGGVQTLIGQLTEVFSDPVFENHEIGIQEVRELARAAPDVGRALISMYEGYQELREQMQTVSARLDEVEASGVDSWRLPSEEVSDFLQRHGNYFPTLEIAAETLRKKAGLPSSDLFGALRGYMESTHGIEVRFVEANHAVKSVRRFDPEERVLFLSELLAPHTVNFQLAHQIGLLEHSPMLASLVDDRHLTTSDSRALMRVALANYFAGAVLMPYDAFLAAAKSVRYDLDMLGHRFRTSFEQVAHRLTTLRRPGNQGVNFHFMRVDIAGNISKRFSASGIQFARFSGTCPRWNLVVAFMTPGQIRTQMSVMPDGRHYFCVARTVNRGERGFHAPPALHAIVLGCKLDEARELVYSDGMDLERTEMAVPVGVTCRLCERMDCEQRAFPPLQRSLHIDENVRGLTFYASLKE